MRFKVGELAIYAVARKPKNIGRIVTIVAVEFTPKGTTTADGTPLVWDCHYLANFIDETNDFNFGCADWQLQKIHPIEDPAALIRIVEEEISA